MWKIVPLFIIVLVVFGSIGFFVRSAGLIGGTAVERAVFKNSYQRSASIDARIATDEAVIAEINAQLSDINLDASTRSALEAQLSAARVRIATAKGQR